MMVDSKAIATDSSEALTGESGAHEVKAAQAKSQRVMSGIRVSGRLHIGHYWGTIRNWLTLQNEYSCYFGAMDWHGMTTVYKDPREMMSWSRATLAECIAFGLDPEKCVLFIQSQVPEHLELYFIFANLTPMGWLERVPTWKDSEEENKRNDTHNLGRFAYPVLQAADIAIYRGSLVPVGQDQVPHLELNREIIRRTNNLYKTKLPEPKPLLTETPMITGLDGRKMSKSYNNTLLLVEDTEKQLRKKVNSMITDPARALRENPGEPTRCSVYGYHKLYSSAEDLAWVETGCRTAGIGCGDCKGRLFENIEKMTTEPRIKKQDLLKQSEQLDKILKTGNEKAREEAQKTLKEIKRAMKWQ